MENISDDSGVQIYQECKKKEGVVAFRGETILPTTLVRIVSVHRDESLRKNCVDSLLEARVIEHPSDFLSS